MRSETRADAGSDPFAPLDVLLHLFTHAAIALAIGLALGIACARMLRRLRLHWSWAALAALLAGVVRAGSIETRSAVVATGLTAALCSRRWHCEDLDAGFDLAEAALLRRRPRDALALACSFALGSWWDFARRAARAPDESELYLGEDERGRPAYVRLGGSGGGSHALITGATGSGKTVTQSVIAARAVSRRLAAIAVDPKGDEQMRVTLARAAADCGREFIEWTPAGPVVYNPYARGSDTEIADKVLASERFTEPHYQRQAQRYLGHVVRALRQAGLQTSLRAIVEQLDPAALELLARDLPGGEATHGYLDTLTARQQSELAGVRDRLAILAESDVGRWLDPEAGTGEQFDLLDAVRSRAVVYFALEADSRPLLAQMLGGAIVQDLQSVVASLQGQPLPSVVVIDEFSSLGAAHVVRLFARARSAGMSLLLGAQELADLRVQGNERLLDQVLGNLSVLIAHRQVVPDSAALTARLSGTGGTWKSSLHGDGRVTRTRVAEPMLQAERLSSLRPGWAAVVDLEHRAQAHIVRVHKGGER